GVRSIRANYRLLVRQERAAAPAILADIFQGATLRVLPRRGACRLGHPRSPAMRSVPRPRLLTEIALRGEAPWRRVKSDPVRAMRRAESERGNGAFANPLCKNRLRRSQLTS